MNLEQLRQMRKNISARTNRIGNAVAFSSVSHLGTKRYPPSKFDFDVYLPDYGVNLQREYIVDDHYRNELIKSAILGRHIDPMSAINAMRDANDVDGYYLIIDGKHRLLTFIAFNNNEFPLVLDGEEFYYRDLPADLKAAYIDCRFFMYVLHEDDDYKLTDREKVEWHLVINTYNIAQDPERLKTLEGLLNV